MADRRQTRLNLFDEEEQTSFEFDETLDRAETGQGDAAPKTEVAVFQQVECLGMTFESEEARRDYFRERLCEKLSDPQFRQIEGFPKGADEDILALSDPPYYTACPNPFIEDFIRLYGKPYDPAVPYHREPFAADVSEGKNDPIYNAHSYHTKVPHKAIMRYILHYTEPGDVVFDGFCGTGMTGVAAQMCGDKVTVESLGYRVQDDGVILDEAGQPFSRLGTRHAILNDLSTAATFIAYNYNTPVNVVTFEREARRIMAEVEKECGWMYETLHTDGKTKGRINYTIWSDVFICPQCANEIVFWDVSVDKAAKQVYEEFPCPNCKLTLSKRNMERAWVTSFDNKLNQPIKFAKQIPALINYNIGGKNLEKRPDQFDLALIERIDAIDIPYLFPIDQIQQGEKTAEPIRFGITYVHHFYTKRNLWVLGAVRKRIKTQQLQFWVTAADRYLSKMSKLGTTYYLHGGGGAVNAGLLGTLYIPSFSVENSVLDTLSTRLPKLVRVFAVLRGSYKAITSCQSSTDFSLPNHSIDYLFIDPPFGSNFMYSELNFLWEAWLKVFTNNKLEAIENRIQGKKLDEYRHLMTRCFEEAFRVLKPGRWMTVEFSNTRASVWNAIQSALQEAGFVVANVSALDKQQGSFKAVTTTTAVKQDLVISAYKPNGGLEVRFSRTAGSEEGVWEFVRSHLRYLPVFKLNKQGEADFIDEREPRLLYDRLVAYYVRHGYPVPLSSQEFQAGLRQRFDEQDGMYFLPEQRIEYAQKSARVTVFQQRTLLIEDEKSAIDWLRLELKKRPSTYQDIQPEFMKQTTAGWKKYETRPDLHALLEESFLRYEGRGPIPSQIVSWLKQSSIYRERLALAVAESDSEGNLFTTDPMLMQAAHERWYVPDPNKGSDLEKKREQHLLKEFEVYKTGDTRKLKQFRLEAVRAGFKKAWQERDYATIVTVARKLPEDVLQEDARLIMWYDQAVLRTEG